MSILNVDNNLEVYFFLQNIGKDAVHHVTVDCADNQGNAMTPFEFYFSMTLPPTYEHGVILEMPDHNFNPGDACFLNAHILNLKTPLPDTPLFLLLEVYGVFFCAPSWVDTAEGIDFYMMDLPELYTTVPILPIFNWPDNVGTLSGLRFYGAILTSDMCCLEGHMEIWEFGWSE